MTTWFTTSRKSSLPTGLLMDGECENLYQLSKGRNLAVDLGTYLGFSAAILSHACKRVHTFDLFCDIAKVHTPDGIQYRELYRTNGHSFDKVRASLARYPNITVEKKDTEQAGYEWNGGPVDVLFVDADHSHRYTLGNVESWYRHLAKGARIIFHDNNDLHPEVQSAIEILQQDCRFRFIDPGYDSGSLAVAEVV